MPQLNNIRHERFARLIAKGKTKTIAYSLAGYKPNPDNASRLWRCKGKVSERIQKRVNELISNSAELSAQDILDRVFTTYELASESGQYSSALKALEMLGKERGLFRDRRETVSINLGAMTWKQTEEYLIERYGEKATELLTWLKTTYGVNNSSQLIEACEASGDVPGEVDEAT